MLLSWDVCLGRVGAPPQSTARSCLPRQSTARFCLPPLLAWFAHAQRGSRSTLSPRASSCRTSRCA
eukprot:807412-Pleurochrysis_carterae.AAC.1